MAERVHDPMAVTAPAAPTGPPSSSLRSRSAASQMNVGGQLRCMPQTGGRPP